MLDLISTYVPVFITAGLGAYLGAYLKKKGENLATHEDVDKLVKQVSAVTAVTKQIEAKITRASRVHERELEILGKLYRHLYVAQALFQNMTRAGRMENEISPEEYGPRVSEALMAAHEDFLNGRLYIPVGLVQLCEQFFSAVSEGQTDFAFSLHPAIDPVKRSEFWKSAGTTAYQQLPKILQQIDDAARAEIHGEAPSQPA